MKVDFLLDNALAYALKNGAEQCELFVSQGETRRVVWGERELKDVGIAINLGFSVRLLKKGALGFSYGSKLSKETLHKAIDSALLACDFLEPEPYFALTPPGEKYATLPVRSFEDISEKQEQDFVADLEARALEGRNIAKVDKATLASARGSTFLKNSLGLDLQYATGYYSCSLLAVAESGGETETGGDFMACPGFNDLKPQLVAETAAFNAANKLGAVSVPGGNYPVVLHSDAVLDLLSVILPGFLGDNIRKGQSMLKGKQGQLIANPDISLYDDGLMPEAIASSPFDDQGRACRKNVLLDHGRVEGFLYDNVAAAKAGTKSTGSGFASSTHSLPVTGFTNYYLAPGKRSLDSLLQEVNNGLYIRDFMGLHMANAVSGEFSLGISGNVIRNGCLGESFRGNMAAGNVFTLLENVIGVGSEPRFYGYRGAPPLLVETLAVSGKD